MLAFFLAFSIVLLKVFSIHQLKGSSINLNHYISPYRIATIRDKTELRHFMNQDRALCAFALGDLEEKMWEMSTYYGAFDKDNLLRGIGLIWQGYETPSLQLFGTSDAIEALLVSDIAPERVFCLVPDQLKDTFGKFYAHETPPIKFWRMAVSSTTFTAGSSKIGLEQLSSSNLDEINELLQNHSPEVRRDDILDSVFYGIRDKSKRLVAVAGTYVCTPSEHVGVIGHVFTDPSVRGRGYGTATTSAVTQALFRKGIDLVALNVVQGNTPAVRAYQKLGYRIHLPIVAGMVRKAIPAY